MQLCKGAGRGEWSGSVYTHDAIWSVLLCLYERVYKYACMWVCGCAIGGQVLLLAWTVGVSCVLYLVRVTGSVVGLAAFRGGVLHSIFQETCLIIYVRIYVYVMLFTCNFLKCVSSRKANFNVIIFIDIKILYSVGENFTVHIPATARGHSDQRISIELHDMKETMSPNCTQ